MIFRCLLRGIPTWAARQEHLAHLFLQRHPGKKLLQLIYSIVWRLLRRRRQKRQAADGNPPEA